MVLCALAGSCKIYSMGMMCQQEEITEKLVQGEARPIPLRMVDKGPVQEVVFMGDRTLERDGLEEFPIPISTPGYDAAPFMTAPLWVTKDPETGIRNVGTYRGRLKSRTHCGIFFSSWQGAAIHWRKSKQEGIPLEAAIVIGGPPSIGYVSVSKPPFDMDEFGAAGAIAGEPVTW